MKAMETVLMILSCAAGTIFLLAATPLYLVHRLHQLGKTHQRLLVRYREVSEQLGEERQFRVDLIPLIEKECKNEHTPQLEKVILQRIGEREQMMERLRRARRGGSILPLPP